MKVRIDTPQPTTKAPYAASVYRRSTAKLRFVVTDSAPSAGTAKAKIVVKNRRGRAAWQSKMLKVKSGVAATDKFRCKLAKGTYKFSVYAADAAGNLQSKIASNKLVVR